MRKALSSILVSAVLLTAGAAQTSPNLLLPAVTMTATGQTTNAIPLKSTTGPGYSLCDVTLTGTGISSVTFAPLVSKDGGASFFPALIWSTLTPGTTGATVTATAAGQFQFSCGNVTHVKFATSSTFTATSVQLVLSASPTAQAKLGGGGGTLTPAGDYASGTTYSMGEIVTENGSSYISLINNNTGNDPSSSPSDWQLIAAAGQPGPTGPSAAGLTITTATAATTITANANPQMLRVNGASLSTVVVTLPAAPDTGEIIYIKNVGAGNVVIGGNGIMIDGNASVTLIAASSQAALSIAFDAVSNTWNTI